MSQARTQPTVLLRRDNLGRLLEPRRSYVLFNHLEDALRDGQVSDASVPDISSTFSKVQGVF